jgi:N-acyl-D-aspartate/D-glutamate deacylase
MAFDLVVRNGVVIDGTGAPAYEGDVGVEGGLITAIGTNLGPGTKEIDAHGNVISPGFIDAHTHMDLFLILYPHGNPVVNYGVTTIVIGDCGASVAPVPEGTEPKEVLIAYLRRVLDNYVDDQAWQWKTFPEYLGYLNGRVGVNVGALVPHSPVRLCVMGEAAYQRAANPQELDRMKRMVAEAMEAGAIGFSTSPRGGPDLHAGTPSTFAEHDEIIELANTAGRYKGIFEFNAFGNIIKPESGFPAMLDRIDALRLGNEFRLRPGARDEGPTSIRYMEESVERGKDIYGVVIPYRHTRRFDLKDAFIFDGLPTWEALKASPAALAERLKDPATRRQIERERIEGAGTPAFPEWAGWDAIVYDNVESGSLKSLETKSVADVALASGKAPVDAFFDTWLADDLRSRFIYHGIANAHLDVLADMIKSPTSLIGTDVGAHVERFFWHGAPTRILGHWWREKHLFDSLEEAVWKITGYPGQKLGLNRGQLKVGWPADITVFDPDRVADLVTERLPLIVDEREVQRHPPGIGAVVVNGQVAVEAGECMDVFPGKVRRQELSAPPA